VLFDEGQSTRRVSEGPIVVDVLIESREVVEGGVEVIVQSRKWGTQSTNLTVIYLKLKFIVM
jgi:hypothetical protein